MVNQSPGPLAGAFLWLFFCGFAVLKTAAQYFKQMS
jgi:hypothetical protein